MNRRNFLKGFLASATVVALAPLAPVIELPVEKATFESIVAVTLKAYRQKLADNITMKQKMPEVMLNMLYAKGCIDGGKSLVEPMFLNSV